jgi:thioredoxin reductase (NADPH)
VELYGRGVSHCATCDGPFFAGHEVCVIGGGDAALEEASVLAGYASKVTVFHRGSGLTSQAMIQARAAEKPNLEVVLNTQVEAILGNDAVTSVRVTDRTSGATREQDMAGVFIFAGLEPNTAFLRGVLDMDSNGHIVTDILMRTSVEGVFAAGDIRSGSVAQVASVAGDGATAAIAARRYLQMQA